MQPQKETYPIIDIFAGPGGLGEGFSSASGKTNKPLFHSLASIERDEHSHNTLLLRHFFRSFPNENAPEEYYLYMKGDITKKELFDKYPKQYEKATKSALRISLGAESHDIVKNLIQQRLVNEKWALIGGPPCQAYSLVGRSRMKGSSDFDKDERHFLYQEYLKIIVDHRPPVFVMENVKGMLSAKVNGEPLIGKIISDLSKPKQALENNENGLSYNLYSLSKPVTSNETVDPRIFLVKAEEYGVPQARHRMFILGIRNDIRVKPNLLIRHSPPTVKEVIGNLPKIRSGLSRETDSPTRWREIIENFINTDLAKEMSNSDDASKVRQELQKLLKGKFPENRFITKYPGPIKGSHPVLKSYFDPHLRALSSHESKAHMPSDIHRYLFAALFGQAIDKSPKMSDFPVSLLPAHKNVDLARIGKMFSDRFRVQLSDRVSTTITSHIAKDGHYFIHYDPAQCRSFTVREAARLQTFPDNYKFEGPRTAQYHQVGNAVPPYLAKQIAEIVYDILERMDS
ncbi:DNA cytosine methyltransferase [Maridesulfovibrio sp. FT414]|uniref:DNA cytosine methyltransferase n=1 Tax=Maridesulfovibrio sp. FT414 TaxID=2979469 RepID=UPI003D8056B9